MDQKAIGFGAELEQPNDYLMPTNQEEFAERCVVRNDRSVKVHWSFSVASAEGKLKRQYEQVNPANKPAASNN